MIAWRDEHWPRARDLAHHAVRARLRQLRYGAFWFDDQDLKQELWVYWHYFLAARWPTIQDNIWPTWTRSLSHGAGKLLNRTPYRWPSQTKAALPLPRAFLDPETHAIATDLLHRGMAYVAQANTPAMRTLRAVLEGESIPDIAHFSQLSAGTIYGRLFRARRRLRRLLHPLDLPATMPPDPESKGA